METTPCEACDGRTFTALFEKAGHHVRRCSHCGLERIDPQPSGAALASIYGEHYYEAWDLRDDGHLVRDMKKATFRDDYRPMAARARPLVARTPHEHWRRHLLGDASQ
jgi:hypothetical protein